MKGTDSKTKPTGQRHTQISYGIAYLHSTCADMELVEWWRQLCVHARLDSYTWPFKVRRSLMLLMAPMKRRLRNSYIAFTCGFWFTSIHLHSPENLLPLMTIGETQHPECLHYERCSCLAYLLQCYTWFRWFHGLLAHVVSLDLLKWSAHRRLTCS